MSLSVELRVVRESGFNLDVSFEVHPGQTLALLGPNGAGKSTTAAALAGLLPIDWGRIILGENVLDDPASGVFVPPHSRNVGLVFQDYVLFPHLSVEENVGFGLRSRGLAQPQSRSRTSRWLTAFDLEGIARKKARNLSGGEAQKVALARALAIEPDFLILDEPLAALDATTRVDLRHQLGDHLAEFQGPKVLITHEPAEAFLLADYICVIEEGTATQSGTADDIRLRPRTKYAADLAGSNLLFGQAHNGRVDVDGHEMVVADTEARGGVLLTIHPRSISVHLRPPEGSPRNTWKTTVDRLEHFGDRVRLKTGAPLGLTIEVTPAAAEELGLAPAVEVWLSVKATEIGTEPD